MGIISVNDVDRLFWAGRYCARALYLYERYTALPRGKEPESSFTAALGLEPKETEKLMLSSGGIIANAVYSWRDNAVRLRHILTGRAAREAEKAAVEVGREDFDMLTLRAYAFFGIAQDRLLSSAARATVAAGRECERLDIMSRFDEDVYEVRAAYDRLMESCGESDVTARLVERSEADIMRRELDEGRVTDLQKHTPLLENMNGFA